MSNYDDILNTTPKRKQENSSPQFSMEDYAVQKRVERDDLFALSDDTAFEVTVDGDKFRQYMDTQSRFDRYSAVNSLLILSQKPEANRLGDFDHWKDKMCSIKPQEKAISILEPQEYTKEDGTLGVGYNVKKVFDISQVNTQRLASDPVPTYTKRQILEALVKNPPVPIVGMDSLPGGAGAVTNPDTCEINVRKGMDFNDAFSSVAKELAAATLKSNDNSRINNDFSAYCVAYMLCKKHGVDVSAFNFKDVGKVFKYLDTKEKKAEFQMIRDAFSEISGKMNRQLESLQKTARSRNEAR